MRIILAIMIMALLVGCASEAPVESQADNLDNPPETDDLPVAEDNPEQTDAGSADTMRFCTNKGQDQAAEYTYYIADDEIYSKTEAGGVNEMVITESETCINTADTGWSCSESTDYEGHRETIEEHTTGTMGSIMKFSCEEVPYDASVFSTG